MKKVLLSILSVVTVAALAITGTIAYLQSEDEDVNVMTLGNVAIAQHEYERVVDANGNYTTIDIDGVKSYELQKFTQAKPLLPATETDANGQPYNYGAGDYDSTRVKMVQVDSHGSMDVFVNKNAQDKFVTVENTGKSDAYVRTVIAMEIGSLSVSRFDEVIGTSSFMTEQGVWEVTDIGPVVIDGNNYFVVEYLYNGAKSLGGVHENGVLPAGDTTYPSLAQVYMTAAATNEDCENIDGNKNGTYDILVLSQAIQTEGFADAKTALNAGFGEANEANVQAWFDGTVVPDYVNSTIVASADEMSAALANGESVVLDADITVDATMTVAAGKEATINLNGHDLSYAVDNNGKPSAIIDNKGNLTIEGKGTISFVAADPDMKEIPGYATNTITNTGVLTIGKGVTVTNASEGGASYAVDVQSGEFILDGGTLIGERCALRIARFNADTKFTMNSGLVKAATPAWIHLPGSDANVAPKIDVTINGGTFQATKATSADNNVLYTYSFGNSHANTTITINGGEFLGGTLSIGSGYKGDVPTLTINGGTFEYDVLQWKADGSSGVLYSANK